MDTNTNLKDLFCSGKLELDKIEHPAIRDIFDEAVRYLKSQEVPGNHYLNSHSNSHTDRKSYWSSNHVDDHSDNGKSDYTPSGPSS